MDIFLIVVNGDVDSVKFTKAEADAVYDSRAAETSTNKVCVIQVTGTITKQTKSI